MRDLTTLERFTLVALQRSNRPMTCETLMSMTMEWREPLEAALDTLIKANLVRSSTEGSRAHYSAVPLSKEPLLPAVSDWLHRFYDKLHPWLLVPGDPEENNSASCALVLLAAVLTGSRDPDFLAHILGLPERFVTLPLWIAKNSEFWWCEQVFDLEAASYKNPDDFADIKDALCCMMEAFDLDYYSTEEWDHLQKLRGGMIFGGSNELILEDIAGSEPI